MVSIVNIEGQYYLRENIHHWIVELDDEYSYRDIESKKWVVSSAFIKDSLDETMVFPVDDSGKMIAEIEVVRVRPRSPKKAIYQLLEKLE